MVTRRRVTAAAARGLVLLSAATTVARHDAATLVTNNGTRVVADDRDAHHVYDLSFPPPQKNGTPLDDGAPRRSLVTVGAGYTSRRFLLAVHEPDDLEDDTEFVQAYLTAMVERWDLYLHTKDHSYFGLTKWYHDPEDKFFDARVRFLGLSGRKQSNAFTVACLLTHRRAWRKILASGVDYGIIYEHDAAFATPHEYGGGQNQYVHRIINEMNAIDPGWDTVNLGRCYDFCESQQQVKQICEYQTVVKSSASGCTHAYVVTQRGAKRLLAWSLPYVTPVDFLVQLLSRRGVLNAYSVTHPFFVQDKSSDANDKDALHECDPSESWLLDQKVPDWRTSDEAVAARIKDTWVSQFLREGLFEPGEEPYYDGPAMGPNATSPAPCADLATERVCRWISAASVMDPDAPGDSGLPEEESTATSGSSSTTPRGATPDEARFLDYLDAAGLDTVAVWGLRSESHTHRFIHLALYDAAARAFRTSSKPRRLCWIPSSSPVCGAPAVTIERALVFASPKHMTYTQDPLLKFLRPNPSSRYIFHELVPPHFYDLQAAGKVAQWVVRGPDGSSPVHEAEHFVLKQAAQCAAITCFINGVYVAPWGTRYSPPRVAAAAAARGLGENSREPTNNNDPVVHFVGTIWWLNERAFCELAAGCHEVGIRVVRHGMQAMPKNACSDVPDAVFDDQNDGLSDAEVVRLYWDSLFVPVFQGDDHLDGDNSYISDRTFDTVARGLKVITNNPLSARLLGVPYATPRDMCRVNQQAPVPMSNPMAVANHTYVSRLNDILDYWAPQR